MSYQEAAVPTMTSTPARFRLRPWVAILLNLMTPLNLAAALFGGWIIYAGITMLAQGPTGASVFGSILLILIPLLVIIPLGLLFAVSQIYIIALKAGTVAFSYVSILPDGLEVSYWPQFHVNCAWNRIERAAQIPVQPRAKLMLRLPGAQTLPDQRLAAWLRPPRMLRPILATAAMQFSPGMFQGYPGGELEAALRQNAPHLFTDVTDRPG